MSSSATQEQLRSVNFTENQSLLLAQLFDQLGDAIRSSVPADVASVGIDLAKLRDNVIKLQEELTKLDSKVDDCEPEDLDPIRREISELRSEHEALGDQVDKLQARTASLP